MQVEKTQEHGPVKVESVYLAVKNAKKFQGPTHQILDLLITVKNYLLK